MMYKNILICGALLSYLYVTCLGQASSFTAQHNRTVLQALPFKNVQDFSDAARGFIAPIPHGGIIKNKLGSTVWDLAQYDFLLQKYAAPSVNPSLWRQGQLLCSAGLFKITDKIYQIRGADVSNMTIVEGDTSILIIDPLFSIECSRVVLDLYYAHRPRLPIAAIIYTHSHIDHFGGVKGITSQDAVDAGQVRIIAPQGFTQAALEENVLAGNVMGRRASYMYGNLLAKGPLGQVTCGLGLTTSTGASSLILPTELIGKTGTCLTIDGIECEFLMAPNSEAPAEFLIYFPDFRALCAAEDATHTMHNLYTLRGAKIRDAHAWSNYLQQAIDAFGSKAEVVFAQHLWPVWGNEKVLTFLEKQRDLYKYLHDQTLRLANHGYTMTEIAEMIHLPESIAQEWYNQGYYGSVNHNVKAIYNFYLGWFDGNPSTLHQLPRVQASKKYVAYMHGSQEILKKAQNDYAAGEYRWVAEVLNHVVYAEPDNREARNLLADTLEQLGFQTQNGTWRNFYLSGCKELRHGINKSLPVPALNTDIINSMPSDLLFDYLAICINGPKAADHPLKFDLEMPDTKELFAIEIKNGVLHAAKKTEKHKAKPATKITLNRRDINVLFTSKFALDELLKSKKVRIQGDAKVFKTFLSLLDHFNFWFNIIEPNTTDAAGAL